RREKVVDHWKVKWEDMQAPPDHVYPIPPGTPPRVFQKVELTDEEMGEAFAASPLRKHLLAPPERPLPMPPLALGMGHIPLLLAAGHLDGLVKPEGELPHVVRG